MTPAARERARVRTPILIASACAWAALLAWPGDSSHGAHHAHHAHHGHEAMAFSVPSLAPLAVGWAIMLVAMMLPLLGTPVRHIQARSFAPRRARATVLFLAGYGAAWMAAGVVLMGAALAIGASAEPLLLGALATVLVIVWQASPHKQVCLHRLHVHPALSAFGAAADRDAALFGVVHGLWCVGSCAGLMLLPMLFASWHLPIMLAVSVWVWAEQLERPAPPRWALRVPSRAARIVLARAGRRRALVALSSR